MSNKLENNNLKQIKKQCNIQLLDSGDILSTIDALNHYEMGLVTELGLKEALEDIIKKL